MTQLLKHASVDKADSNGMTALHHAAILGKDDSLDLLTNANLDATAERTEVHKNMARAYRQWFEATGDEAHFEGIVSQYEQALVLSPRDMTATYNLAVNIYNRGVAQINAMDENTTLPEILAINESSRALFERALPWFEQADVLQPNRPETLRGLMIVHHALFHPEQEDAYRNKIKKALTR